MSDAQFDDYCWGLSMDPWGSDGSVGLGPSFTSCRNCGKPGLRWSARDHGWVLVEIGGRRHSCDPDKRAEFLSDELPDIE